MNSFDKRKLNIISNRNFISRKTSEILKTSFREHGFIVSEKYLKDAELNIIVGGDGAFLRAVHDNNFPDIPFIGVNTGHLGFFQEICPDKIDDFVRKYILQEFFIEKMTLMETEIVTSKESFYIKSINEIFVKTTDSKVIHLDLYIEDKHLQRFSGDGLIISTPYGSTAYNYSAGGAIMCPDIRALQITPLAPIISKAFRSLPNSLVIPGDLSIIIRPEHRHKYSTIIVNDGNEFFYKDVKYIKTKFANDEISKLTFEKDRYLDNLKNKFL